MICIAWADEGIVLWASPLICCASFSCSILSTFILHPIQNHPLLWLLNKPSRDPIYPAFMTLHPVPARCSRLEPHAHHTSASNQVLQEHLWAVPSHVAGPSSLEHSSHPWPTSTAIKQPPIHFSDSCPQETFARLLVYFRWVPRCSMAHHTFFTRASAAHRRAGSVTPDSLPSAAPWSAQWLARQHQMDGQNPDQDGNRLRRNWKWGPASKAQIAKLWWPSREKFSHWPIWGCCLVLVCIFGPGTTLWYAVWRINLWEKCALKKKSLTRVTVAQC